ncbi:Nectin-1 isoform X1 [Aix galericulata]|nr:Nectin-1 isoform X1 [Aix galericulata]
MGELYGRAAQTRWEELIGAKAQCCCALADFGKCHSEIPNASDYLTRCYPREGRYLEKIPHAYAPLSDLPRDLYPQHPDVSFCCPPPGSRAPYICPKEQYV